MKQELKIVIKKSEEDLRRIIEEVRLNLTSDNDAITEIQILISEDFS